VHRFALAIGDRKEYKHDAGHSLGRVYSKSMQFIVLLPYSPAEVDQLLVSFKTTDVMLAAASLRGHNRIHLMMPAQITAIDTIRNDLSRFYEVDQQSGTLFVPEAEPTFDEIVPRPWITTSLIRDGLWHVD